MASRESPDAIQDPRSNCPHHPPPTTHRNPPPITHYPPPPPRNSPPNKMPRGSLNTQLAWKEVSDAYFWDRLEAAYDER